MPPTPDNPSHAAAAPSPEDEGTGLPLLRTWRALYIFVAIVFTAWVAILYALTRAFS